MPQRLDLWFHAPGNPSLGRKINVEVATEEELLDFANKVREAAGAELLPALLPSRPDHPYSCLIANAVNFKSEVNTFLDPHTGDVAKWPSGAHKWAMFPRDAQIVETLAEKLALELALEFSDVRGGVVLPEAIGNAAQAFDAGEAFDDLVDGERF